MGTTDRSVVKEANVDEIDPGMLALISATAGGAL